MALTLIGWICGPTETSGVDFTMDWGAALFQGVLAWSLWLGCYDEVEDDYLTRLYIIFMISGSCLNVLHVAV